MIYCTCGHSDLLHMDDEPRECKNEKCHCSGFDLCNPFITCYSGIDFYPLSLTPEMIDINDIARSLSMTPRFRGHMSQQYTVAEHCLNMYQWLRYRGEPKIVQLQGLLHDAQEAYLCDVPTPFKQLFPGYKELEDKIQRAIYAKYYLPLDTLPQVHLADRLFLHLEGKEYAKYVSEYPEEITEEIAYRVNPIEGNCWSVRDCFLKHFKGLV